MSVIKTITGVKHEGKLLPVGTMLSGFDQGDAKRLADHGAVTIVKDEPVEEPKSDTPPAKTK